MISSTTVVASRGENLYAIARARRLADDARALERRIVVHDDDRAVDLVIEFFAGFGSAQ